MFASASLRKSNCVPTDLSVKDAAGMQSHDIETSLQLTLRRAASHIVHGDCFAARELLKGIIAENVDHPEIYNLFGISFEQDGDRLKASRFYRVSYYMDQTFKAAADNLYRVCEFHYNSNNDSIAWGIDMREVRK